MQKTYKEALYPSTHENNKNMIYDTNGRPYIEIKNDILKGIPKSKWVVTIKEALKSNYPDGIDMGFFKIAVNAKSRNEFLNSDYTKRLKAEDDTLYTAKMKMAENLSDIVKMHIT